MEDFTKVVLDVWHMQYSEVLIKILERASEIQKGTKVECVSAPAFFTAITELCGTQYYGITNYQSELYPVWYEEERLRYLFGKLFRASGNLVAHSIKRRMPQELSEYYVDFLEAHKEELESHMTERGLSVLTSDIVFLVALSSFSDRQRMGLHPEYQEQICIRELLSELDACIYDYVISEIEKIKQELRLTIISVDGIYYVKDSQGVMGCFCQIFAFMKYLQKLIMLAEKKKTNYTPTFDEVDVYWSMVESFDAKALLEELKQCVVVRYDENRGLILSIVHMCYANQNTSGSFVFKTWDDGAVTVSDGSQSFERNEYLETFYQVEKIADGNYLPLLFRFFYCAVQLTEMETQFYNLCHDYNLTGDDAGCY